MPRLFRENHTFFYSLERSHKYIFTYVSVLDVFATKVNVTASLQLRSLPSEGRRHDLGALVTRKGGGAIIPRNREIVLSVLNLCLFGW
jgi:hypothetical protein